MVTQFQKVDFKPLRGLGSPDVQMILSTLTFKGQEAPSSQFLVHLEDGDAISCQVSTPIGWGQSDKTIVLLHGLGGSHRSPFLVRLSQKFFKDGYQVVRINLRGCGSGEGLNALPYHSGNSPDVYATLKAIKAKHPTSPLYLIGFSLSGNIVLKMAGEAKSEAAKFIHRMVAVCPVLDLFQCQQIINSRRNVLYHRYFLKHMLKQSLNIAQAHTVRSIYEFDQKITAPLWGYASAEDYYEKCSSKHYIPEIKVPCDLLFSEDDPFIDHSLLHQVKIGQTTNAFLSPKGSHIGFIGWSGFKHGVFWLDHFLDNWIKRD